MKFLAAMVISVTTCYAGLKWVRPWVVYQSAERRIDRQCADARHQMKLLKDDQLYFFLTGTVDRI